MSIYTLSYHSRNLIEELTPYTLTEIDKLLITSRSRNEAADVTGALMFNEERFTQILEGPRVAVTKIFDSIKRDNRHCDVTIIATQMTSSRRFESWSMAFVGRSPAARAYYANYVNRKDFDWKAINQDYLSRFMKDLMHIDESESN